MKIVLSDKERGFVGFLVSATALALGVGVASQHLLTIPVVRPSVAELTAIMKSGPHLTFVLVAPTANSDTALTFAIRRAHAVIKDRSKNEHLLFSSIGISDTWNTDSGVVQLSEIAKFDEIIVGRNWLNTGVAAYINSFGAQAAVPQVIIVTENIDTEKVPHVYSSRREVARLVGRRELEEWLASGAPLAIHAMTNTR